MARKRREASVTKRRNTAPGFNTLDPILCSIIVADKGVRTNWGERGLNKPLPTTEIKCPVGDIFNGD